MEDENREDHLRRWALYITASKHCQRKIKKNLVKNLLDILNLLTTGAQCSADERFCASSLDEEAGMTFCGYEVRIKYASNDEGERKRATRKGCQPGAYRVTVIK